jgi:hypothetical protein
MSEKSGLILASALNKAVGVWLGTNPKPEQIAHMCQMFTSRMSLPLDGAEMLKMRTQVRGGIFDICLSPTGVTAFIGQGPIGTTDLFLSTSNGHDFMLYTNQPKIEHLQFAGDSPLPIYAVRDTSTDQFEWYWGLTRIFTTKPSTIEPVFWKNEDGKWAAFNDISRAAVYRNTDGRFREWNTFPSSEEQSLVHMQVISGHLLEITHQDFKGKGEKQYQAHWNNRRSISFDEWVPYHIVSGEDTMGTPYLVVRLNSEYVILGIDGAMSQLTGINLGCIWSQPGFVFHTYPINEQDSIRFPIKDHHGWSTSGLENHTPHQIWKIDHPECRVVSYDRGSGEMVGYDLDGHPVWMCLTLKLNNESTKVRMMGNVFVAHCQGRFLILKQEGRDSCLLGRHRLKSAFNRVRDYPDHGLELSDLILMGNRTIQAIKALDGGQVVRYQLYNNV